ncbi:aminotransferase class V-fold PLP-dependent enzyme [Micromonospora sp. WMMD882]|uniref:aminotransferase class V-fold PLP-dependent enzyme n=1 Tax=Micromonospora sp. WMMD882 TaxID=3015151 RepID=UPI00248BB7A6|nr:aminotransferase class V-fold PLP-dependent enzyme [Micromonospora sp. WMMD882]WBB78069.1 aminotransferase class V-fold PLP-dependent enzyme [Micromonospora sp. WMMD882]
MKPLCPRTDFPPLDGGVPHVPDLVYLDSAATSLTPRPVIDAVRSYYETSSANIHRGKHMLSDLASEAYEECRFAVADFLRVRHSEVVLTRNTTHGLNILANGLPLTPEDRVLVAADNHHSALLPWQRRCVTERIGTGDDPQASYAAYRAALTAGPPPRAVVLSHCSNVTGIYLDVAPWVAAAREVGALVILDAAQTAPHRELDPVGLGVDAVVFSAHKMLGPTGIGVLWAGTELLESLTPTEIGGGTVDWVDDDGFRWRAVPHRLEAGTPDVAAAYGFTAALQYLRRTGMRRIREHDHEVAGLMVDEARKRDLSFLGDRNSSAERAATLSLFWPGMSGARMDVLARALSDSYGVMCRSGYLCSQPLVTRHAEGPVLRLSGYVYTGADDVTRAFAALDELAAAGMAS